MNKLYNLIYTICLILILFPTKIYSQDVAPNSLKKEKLIVAAREIIKDAGTCALITLDTETNPMVRIMDPFQPESDFTVWFGTKSGSRKVNHIENNPTVTLYYQDRDGSGYVVIHGKAKIITDKREKEKRWKVEWEAFYPNKEEYILIKVSPEWMEIISYTRGIVGDPVTWQAPIVTFE